MHDSILRARWRARNFVDFAGRWSYDAGAVPVLSTSGQGMVPDKPRRTSSRMPVESVVYATVRSGLKSNPLTLGRHDDGERPTAEAADAAVGEGYQYSQ